jgi:hypothetical protein
MGLITETNYQYYEGSQIFVSTGAAGQVLQCTFDSQLDDHDRPPNIQTELNVTSIGNMFEVGPTIYNLTNQNAQPNQVGVGLTITIDTLAGVAPGAATGGLGDFTIIDEGTGYKVGDLLVLTNPNPGSGSATLEVTKVPTSSNANYVIELRGPNDNDYSLYQGDYYLSGNNQITIPAAIAANTSIKVRFIDSVKWNNYGGYEYIPLSEIVSNFMNVYVGSGNIIANARRSDVIFHAKRALQEFSYDTLKSVKSQELTIPHSLSVVIPQDYVNYVQLSWIDQLGVKHIIYPANKLTSNPLPVVQDSTGLPAQGNYGQNLEYAQSLTTERWKNADDKQLTGQMFIDEEPFVYGFDWWKLFYGQRYGIDPQLSQKNGWFTIDERKGTFCFSSNLHNKLIILDYISDGLAYDVDTKVPKMAEEAMYTQIIYSILSVRANVPEYIINRYRREKSSKLRNAKIRLSNIKLEAFTQVMRGKSKWIKH